MAILTVPQIVILKRFSSLLFICLCFSDSVLSVRPSVYLSHSPFQETVEYKLELSSLNNSIMTTPLADIPSEGCVSSTNWTSKCHYSVQQ